MGTKIERFIYIELGFFCGKKICQCHIYIYINIYIHIHLHTYTYIYIHAGILIGTCHIYMYTYIQVYSLVQKLNSVSSAAKESVNGAVHKGMYVCMCVDTWIKFVLMCDTHVCMCACV